MLCAPAVIVMNALTPYSIGYAIHLYLQRYDLRFPAQAKFIGLANYGTVLAAPFWWRVLVVTVILTMISDQRNRDHHSGGGLGDDAVHGAAAHSRPLAGARGPPDGGKGQLTALNHGGSRGQITIPN
jgi:uncharacterized membrane protein